MKKPLLVAIVLALPMFVDVGETSAATNLTREQIRAMPMLNRPYRMGHFYGNTVRRAHTRADRRH